MEPAAPLLRLAFAASLFAYPALLVTAFDKAAGRALGAALTLAIVALFPYRELRALVSRDDAAPFAAMLLLLTLGTVSALAWNAPQWMFVNHGRLLGVIFAVLAIRKLQPSSGAFYLGCAFAALTAGTYAIQECLVDGLARAGGPNPPFGAELTNIFAGIAVVLGFVPIAAGRPARRIVRGIAWAGLAGGLVAASLSGSRGAWIAAAALALWIFGRRRVWFGVALALAFVLASLSVDMLASRWSAGYSDIVMYGNGNAATSIGSRFDLWRTALAAFEAHPLLGLGPDGFRAFLLDRGARGEVSGYALQYGHAHNEWLQALATGGLVQALALAAVFATCWRRFRDATRRRDSPAGRAGEVVVLGFFVLGFSDTFFIHRVALTAFVVMLAWLLAWVEQPADRW